MSLYIIQGAARGTADLTSFGHRARIWTRGATTFVLISAPGAANLDRAARYVMQEAR
jgi:hypothetical protein